MKILQIQNRPRQVGAGGDVVVDQTTELLKRRGVSVYLVTKSSGDLNNNFKGKFKAFTSGIYSRSSYQEMVKIIKQQRPDVVHAHNLYPLFSPSVLVACRNLGVPVVMTLHSFYLVCPTHFLFVNGEICERCCFNREYWCVLKNCRGNLFESIAYSLRTSFARKYQLFKNNVSAYILLSGFSRSKLIEAGFDKERLVVIPNMIKTSNPRVDPCNGQYIAYLGRISPEKGVDILLAGVAKLPYIKVKVAGDGPQLSNLMKINQKNVEFLGWLERKDVSTFIQGARFLVLPSLCYEMCPIAILEAMIHGLPVIASRNGGNSELVDDGVTGLLFESGNSDELSKKIQFLWNNTDLCRKMGAAGREKVIRNNNEDVYFNRLISAYELASKIGYN